jgi:hypothetical protein
VGVQVLDVVTGPDGRYDAPGIGGGRYRVRAFLAPTMAMAEGEVLFLADGEERSLDLRVDVYSEPEIAIAVAPDPPLLDEPVNLAVAVSGRLVDQDGVVRTQPLAGATVQVTVLGGWSALTPSVATTGGDGQAQFRALCGSTAPTQVQVSLRVPGAVPGTAPTTATFDVPTCVDPATLTTTTTAPAGPSTSSTSSTEPAG